MAQENGPWQRQGPCVFAEASNCRVPPEGLEPGDVTPSQPEHLRQTLNQRAAECAAVGDDLPPLDQSGGAVLLEGFAWDEMAVEVEVVMNCSMCRRKFMQCFGVPEFRHRPFSSSKGVM